MAKIIKMEQAEAEAPETTPNPVTGGFTAEFVEHSDGSTSFRLFGDISLRIDTAPIGSFEKVPEKAVELELTELYVSPIVRNPQISLRDAMEWTARQAGVHAVQAAWNEVYPSERTGNGRVSVKAKLEAQTAENAALNAQNAEMAAMIAELKARLGIADDEAAAQ